MYGLQQKLKFVKGLLKKWNKESFGHILTEKRRLEDQIGELQSRIMSGGYSEIERSTEQGLIQEMIRREKQEEILWQQKSRKLWFEGDRNTRFFHRSTIQNHHHIRISCLKCPIVQVVEKKSELEH